MQTSAPFRIVSLVTRSIRGITRNRPLVDSPPPLTTLREKLVKTGTKVVHHIRYVIFQLAEVAIPRRLFRAILERIRLLCLPETAPR